MLKVEPALLAAGIEAREVPRQVGLRKIALASPRAIIILLERVLDDPEIERFKVGKSRFSVSRFAKEKLLRSHKMSWSIALVC